MGWGVRVDVNVEVIFFGGGGLGLGGVRFGGGGSG